MDIRTKDPTAPERITRVLMPESAAEAFRKLCRLTEKTPGDLMKDMLRVYVQTEHPELEVVDP